jgi:TPR repeat protein
MCGGGKNVPIDRGTAQRWFRAAAELGHGHSQLMLARYLASGAARKSNPVEARIWLERAVAQGVLEAARDLAELASPIVQ